jgi:predicted small integral membrane protein
MIRWIKTFLVALVALFFTLVVFGNLTDFKGNLLFVEHVLKMDSTYLSPNIMWRAIDNYPTHVLAYVFIILVELVAAVILWIGSYRLFKSCHDSDVFKNNKYYANLGLVVGIALYFGGFIVIGGEWFAMWQSSAWNGVDAAARFSMLLLFVLLFLNQQEN